MTIKEFDKPLGCNDYDILVLEIMNKTKWKIYNIHNQLIADERLVDIFTKEGREYLTFEGGQSYDLLDVSIARNERYSWLLTVREKRP